MLKSNWSQGSAAWFGARVIRQRVSRAAPAKSVAGHVFMDRAKRLALCAALEHAA